MSENRDDEIFRALGRIEGKLEEMAPAMVTLTERVTSLEKWQAYLKGAWVVGVVIWGYILKVTFGIKS